MLSTLEFIREKPTREELLDYLRAENPEQKDSSRGVTINSLKSEFGVIRHDGTHYSLTERGDVVLESGDPNELSDWLLTRILGVDHVIHALADSPKTSAQVTELLQKVNPGWTTSFRSQLDHELAAKPQSRRTGCGQLIRLDGQRP